MLGSSEGPLEQVASLIVSRSHPYAPTPISALIEMGSPISNLGEDWVLCAPSPPGQGIGSPRELEAPPDAALCPPFPIAGPWMDPSPSPVPSGPFASGLGGESGDFPPQRRSAAPLRGEVL